MKKEIISVLTMALMLCATSIYADQPTNSAYLAGKESKTALILCHGRGKHPTWKVVDPLRKGVNEQLGYHTLSLQMPNDDKHAKKYADDFPKAYATIKDGIRYLRDEKGVTTIFLMGHSMGSRMASAFVAENSNQPITGLIVAGCRNNLGYPLDCKQNLQNVDIPVLDIWGGNDDKDLVAAGERKALISANYQQVEIPDANHKFDGQENTFVSSVVEWLRAQP